MDGYLFMETRPHWLSGIQDLDASEFPPTFPITFHISQFLDKDTELQGWNELPAQAEGEEESGLCFQAHHQGNVDEKSRDRYWSLFII